MSRRSLEDGSSGKGRWRARTRFWADTLCVIRLNGVLMVAAVVAAWSAAMGGDAEIESVFERGMFFRDVTVILSALVGFYLLAILIPWAWFLLTCYVLRRDRNQILFTFPSDACVHGEPFAMQAILQRKLRLLFGVIRFRLVFFDYSATDWHFLLGSQRRRGELFNSAERGAIGSFSLTFRHLGRYRTRYSVVRFEDPFHILALPIIEREYARGGDGRNFMLYSLPPVPAAGTAPAFMKRQSVPSVSEQRFRVAEDYFDHKRYEPTDDSRRIMWKVYARTRSLYVRIPERDPVVDADLEIHAIFHHAFLHCEVELLRAQYDRYVSGIAALMEGMARRRALTMTFITDDPGDPPYQSDPALAPEDNLRRALVSAQWHAHTGPAEFIARMRMERPKERERILVLSPYVPSDILPTHEFPWYARVVVLGGTEAEHSAPLTERLLFARSEGSGSPAALVRRRRLQRAIAANARQVLACVEAHR